MRILLISPYHGGSHQAWAESYQRNSRHEVSLLTMPARFWKWRMHGGAITLARLYVDNLNSGDAQPDLIVATDMLDLTTFLALTRRYTADTRVVLYMHENQLTYPLPADPRKGPMRRQWGERDRNYAFINFASMLAADRVCFNSDFHMQQFFAELYPFLRHYPEYNELDTVEHLRSKSDVLPVGIDLARLDNRFDRAQQKASPLIIWNQRMEYDKNPAQFIRALLTVAGEGLDFRVALCGERFGRPEPELIAGIDALGERIIYNGFADDATYAQLLGQAAITCSTANHEYFGVGVIEAIYARTFPVLPHRLSYPEIIPTEFHAACLYHTHAQLLERLRWALANLDTAAQIAERMAHAVARYDWRQMAPVYDGVFAGTA